MSLKKVGGALGTLALLSVCVSGQEFRASLSGQVTDPTGAAIVGAAVTARNLATNVRMTTRTLGDGGYALPYLPPGDYELTAEAPGFRQYTRRGITLSVGEKAIVSIRMEVGLVTESVTVSAELIGIETSESVMGQLMGRRMVSELPLSGRQVFQLLQLTAGVRFTQERFGATGHSGTRAWDVSGAFTMHGSRTNTNAFMLDGAPLGITGEWTTAPSVDAVEEFSVVVPASDASQGLTGGGVVNMTIKSGTNEIHGLLSNFTRNHKFDAYTTQTKRAAAERPELLVTQHQWNHFNAMIGGPVIKNKLFYWGSYEGFRQRVPFPMTVSIPTMEQRVGDFTGTLNSAGQLILVYDPLTTREVGNTLVRDVLPGNRVPASRMVRVSQNIAKLFPEPNTTTDPVTKLNNYAAVPNVGKYTYDAYHGKMNYVWSEAHRTTVSLTQNWGTEYRKQNGLPPPLTLGDNYPSIRDHSGFIFDHVYVVSATTVINTRASWDYYNWKMRADALKGFDVSQLGFKSRPGASPDYLLPRLSWTDYVGAGPFGYYDRPNNLYTLVLDASRTARRQVMKFGARVSQARFGRDEKGDWGGNFSFTKAFTQRDPLRADATSGHAMASFLLGFPASGGTDVNPTSNTENKIVGLYFQDDIKLTPKLMLSLGLRWDLQTPATERYNRLVWGFDPDVTYKLGAATARGGFIFADQKRRRPWDTKWRDFQPRTGLAYGITRRVTFRSAYGLSFLPIRGTGGIGGIQQNGFALRTPFVATTGGGAALYTPGLPGTGTFEDPFPTGILQPPGSSLGPRTHVGQSISYVNRGYVIPRVHQFNAGFEFELPWSIKLEASYVGTRTRRWPVTQTINAIPLEERLKGVENPAYLTAAVPNPFFGAPELAGTGMAAATISRAQALMPYPQFTGLSRSGNSIGRTTYDSLQTRVNKRFSHGLTFISTYTWEKNLEETSYLEPQYTQLERVLAANDRTHTFTWLSVYELPVGRGKRFGATWGRGLDLLAGNWQYNITLEHMSGIPTTMPNAFPVRDPRLPKGQQSFDRWFNTCTLLTTGARFGCVSPDEPIVWVQRRPNDLRTFSTRFPNLRNHWIPRVNMSLFKTFPLRESVRLEFRAEAFNATNTPHYAGPDTTVAGLQFGRVIRDQQNFPRSMQFALRLMF